MVPNHQVVALFSVDWHNLSFEDQVRFSGVFGYRVWTTFRTGIDSFTAFDVSTDTVAS